MHVQTLMPLMSAPGAVAVPGSVGRMHCAQQEEPVGATAEGPREHSSVVATHPGLARAALASAAHCSGSLHGTVPKLEMAADPP